MDKTQVIKWAVWAVARGLAWILAAKLGYDATEAQSVAQAGAEALGAVALVGLSIYDSVKNRKKLLATPPPDVK